MYMVRRYRSLVLIHMHNLKLWLRINIIQIHIRHSAIRITYHQMVAYSMVADKYFEPLASRLSGVNQPVIRSRTGFSAPR